MQKFLYIILKYLFIAPLLCISIIIAQPINNIQFKGNVRIQTEYLQSLITVPLGSEYNEEIVNITLKKIFNTDLFINISSEFNNGILTISLVEAPIISSVEISGNSKIKSNVIEKDMISISRNTFSQNKLNLDIKRINEIYYRSGYLTAQVNYTLQQNNENNSIEIKINIIEGKKTVIKDIKFIGNKAFTHRQLQGVILTKPNAWWRFLNAGEVYDKSRILNDGELLRQFYLEQGYPNFTLISTTSQLSPITNQFAITYILEEGNRYKFGDVNFKINIDGLLQYQNDLFKVITINKTDWFKYSTVTQQLEFLNNKIKTLGFQFIAVREEISYNDVLQTINITFIIEQEPRIYVNRIETVGNTKTKDYVIRRVLKFNENDELTTTKINIATRNLYKTQFFGNVNIQAQPSEEPAKQNVIVAIEEKPTATITAGGGYSTGPEKFNINASLSDQNFLGTGNFVGVDFKVSSQNTNYAIQLANPYFLNKELYGYIKLSREKTSNFFGTNSDRNYDYVDERLSLGVGHLITQDLRHNIYYSIARNEVSNSKSAAYINGTTIESSVTNIFSLDKTNNAVYPSRGTLSSISTEYAGLGGDLFYLKNTFKTIWYQKIYNDVVFSTLFSAGHINKMFGKPLRSSDKFSIGEENLRGFKITGMDDVGPVIATKFGNNYSLGGQSMFRGSFQLESPFPGVSNYSLLVHIFNDYGTVTDFKSTKGSYIRNDGIRSSAGAGLTWSSPLGVLNLDIAFPVIKKPNDNTNLISFTIGTRF